MVAPVLFHTRGGHLARRADSGLGSPREAREHLRGLSMTEAAKRSYRPLAGRSIATRRHPPRTRYRLDDGAVERIRALGFDLQIIAHDADAKSEFIAQMRNDPAALLAVFFEVAQPAMSFDSFAAIRAKESRWVQEALFATCQAIEHHYPDGIFGRRHKHRGDDENS